MSIRWTSYFAPKLPQKEGAQKRKTAVFQLKSHFAWRKSATKFLCVKTVSDAFVGLHIRAKLIGGAWRPFLRKNLTDTDPHLCKTPAIKLFSLVAPQP